MTHYSWGFQKENIVYLPAISKNFTAAYEEEIRRNPSVLDCTMSDALPGSIEQNWGMELNGKEVALAVWVVRLLTVSARSYRSATANPTEALNNN
jgi:hypothetical protein